MVVKQKLDGLPEYLIPRLRVFLSADLVGSTAFKQKPNYPLKIEGGAEPALVGPRWLNPITDFYVDFSAHFSRHWANYVQKAGQTPQWSAGDPPEFWKGIGDEVVFVKDLSHPQELYGTVYAWLEAIRSYRKELLEKQLGLDLKSSVWVAGFPINNSEVVFDAKVNANKGVKTDDARVSHFQKLGQFYQKPERDQYVRDFIGASIDTGFRISSKATPRRMVVSLETVLLLCSITVADNKFPPFHLFFEGYEVLKGVLNGLIRSFGLTCLMGMSSSKSRTG